MIPLRDANPVRSTPIVNRLLLAVNLVAWIYVVYLTRQPGALESFFDRYSFDWLTFTGRIASGDLGVTTFVPLVSHMFLHGGWLHVLGNMLYLWIFGDNVEDRLGHGTFTVFYFVCGLAATFAQLMFNAGSHVPNLGASGAIAGVLGSYILLFPQGRVRVLQGQQVVQMPALLVIGFWIVLQVFSGVGSISTAGDTGGVAYMAHVGGFLAGCVLTLVLRARSAATV